MPRRVYSWERFWCPRGGEVSLDDDGFLVDPHSEYAQYFTSDVVGFDKVANSDCAVLLGEPGIGKSTALRAEFESLKAHSAGVMIEPLWFDLRDYASDDRLERHVFWSESIERWRKSTDILHLFLDSLDEGLLRIDNISRVLVDELKRLPCERLRLRIASRSAEWQATLEVGLKALWERGLGVFEMAPLRKVDVEIAARMWAIDSNAFISAVISKSVVPLAIKPVTLEFLLGAFGGTELPSSRSDLYREGCRRLCEETNEHRRDSFKGRERLSPSQRLSVAARIAAVTQLSNRTAIWTGTEVALQEEDISLDTLLLASTNGSENRETTAVEIREVLDTGLFSSRGLQRHGWRHLTYAEYLAAYYLNINRVTVDQLRFLLTLHDDSGRVVPQLRELAAWVASDNDDFMRELIQSDPEVALRTDPKGVSDAARRELTESLLAAYRNDEVAARHWELSPYFDRLTHPEMADVLRPIISNHMLRHPVRIAAVDIAAACGTVDLQQDILTIALRDEEDIEVRRRSVLAIELIGNPETKAALGPLATQKQNTDIKDDLKGATLAALWPDHLSADRLFAALTPVKDGSYIGAYQRFLASGIARGLTASDVVPALEWARTQLQNQGTSDTHLRVAIEILEHAVDYLHTEGVLPVFSAALFACVMNYQDCSSVVAALSRSGDLARWKVASAMLVAASGHQHGALFLLDCCAIRNGDVPWLLTQLSGAAAVHRVVAEVIARAVDCEDVNVWDSVLVKSEADQVLAREMRPLVAAVMLDSPEATQQRELHRRRSGTRPAPRKAVPASEIVRTVLADDQPDPFFRLYFELHRRCSITRNDELFPCWHEYDDDGRKKIISAATEYLRALPQVSEANWWVDRPLTWGMLAGYTAVYLLACEQPGSLSCFTQEQWDFWARAVAARASDVGTTERALMISLALSHAADVFISALADIVDHENRKHGRIPSAQCLVPSCDARVAAMLRTRLTDASLKTGAFGDLLRLLLSMRDPQTVALVRSFVLANSEIPEMPREQVVIAAAELIRACPEDWDTIWGRLKSDIAFATQVLERITDDHFDGRVTSSLSEAQILDLCLWFVDQGLHIRHEDDSACDARLNQRSQLSDLWNQLVNALVYRGTAEACDALHTLSCRLPAVAGLRWCLAQAKEQTRWAIWIPPKPEDVIRAALSPSGGRLVISVHGIRTRGEWQKRVNSILQASGFRHELLDYGFFRAWRLLIPSQRARQVKQFVREYERVTASESSAPSVIAHSFGTYIVASALERYLEVRFHRLILCGSIIRRDYDWQRLVKTRQVTAVLNEYGGRDLWSQIAGWVIRDGGASGRYGFDKAGSNVYARRRPTFRHSDYFYELNYRENWIPFLNGARPAPSQAVGRVHWNWRFIVVCVLLGGLLAAALYWTASF